MDRTFLASLVIVVLIVLLGLMVVGWQRRKKRQSSIAAPATPPEHLGATKDFAGKYVATSRGANPLDRIAVRGLGFRGPVTVSIAPEGILIALSATDVWIPAADVRDVRRATWTIDRVVEKDGMTLIEWTLGGEVVDTYLRMDEVAAFDVALAELKERQTQ